MKVLRKLVMVEWSGLAAAILLGGAVLSFLAPNFLTEFNIYVMLRSFCVSLLVGFAQMVTLGVGQLNLSVGALGGLIAICLGGMIEVYHVPLILAVPVAIALGALGGAINGFLTVRTGINGFIITLATASAFTGINFGLTRSIPFYNMPPSLVAFGSERIAAFPYLLIAPLIVAALLGIFFARTVPGRQLLAYGGNAVAAELSGISNRRTIVLAHGLSGTLAGIAAILAVAQLGSAQPTIGADWLLLVLRRPDHRRCGADRRLHLGARHDVRGCPHRAHREWHGARQGRSLLGRVPARRPDPRRRLAQSLARRAHGNGLAPCGCRSKMSARPFPASRRSIRYR